MSLTQVAVVSLCFAGSPSRLSEDSALGKVVVKKRRRDDDDDEDEMDLDAELEQLMEPRPAKKRMMMRMRADEEEERIKAQRSGSLNLLSRVSFCVCQSPVFVTSFSQATFRLLLGNCFCVPMLMHTVSGVQFHPFSMFVAVFEKLLEVFKKKQDFFF